MRGGKTQVHDMLEPERDGKVQVHGIQELEQDGIQHDAPVHEDLKWNDN